MSVTLTIKQVPDDIARVLRSRAERNHRSLQGELMAIIEAVAIHDGAKHAAAWQPASGSRADPRHASDEDDVNHLDSPTDDLLADLDAIVAGSQWGAAPLLTRGQANDRQQAHRAELPPQKQRNKNSR